MIDKGAPRASSANATGGSFARSLTLGASAHCPTPRQSGRQTATYRMTRPTNPARKRRDGFCSAAKSISRGALAPGS